MRGYNLWTYRDHVIYLLESRMNTGASADMTEPVLLRALNDAHLEACRIAGFRRSTELLVNTVAAQFNYALPAQVMHDKIVQIRYGSGENWCPLTRISLERFMEIFPTGTTQTGAPSYYAVVPYSRSFWVGPTPDQSLTGAIKIVAETLPDPLCRVYQSSRDTVTAAIANGSNVVTFSGTATGEFLPGDEIGFIPTVQSDASLLDGASPVQWYTVSTVANPQTALSLGETYGGRALTASGFIVAQVPHLEYACPGLYGFMVPQLAAARLLTTRNPDVADRLRMEAVQQFETQTDTSFRSIAPKTAVARRSTLLRGY
jgi:hypothetical protein